MSLTQDPDLDLFCTPRLTKGAYLGLEFTSSSVSQPLSPDSEILQKAARGFSGGSEPLLIRGEVASYRPATPWSVSEVRFQFCTSRLHNIPNGSRKDKIVVSIVCVHTHTEVPLGACRALVLGLQRCQTCRCSTLTYKEFPYNLSHPLIRLKPGVINPCL